LFVIFGGSFDTGGAGGGVTTVVVTGGAGGGVTIVVVGGTIVVGGAGGPGGGVTVVVGCVTPAGRNTPARSCGEVPLGGGVTVVVGTTTPGVAPMWLVAGATVVGCVGRCAIAGGGAITAAEPGFAGSAITWLGATSVAGGAVADAGATIGATVALPFAASGAFDPPPPTAIAIATLSAPTAPSTPTSSGHRFFFGAT
jgi:hypothetical protein